MDETKAYKLKQNPFSLSRFDHNLIFVAKKGSSDQNEFKISECSMVRFCRQVFEALKFQSLLWKVKINLEKFQAKIIIYLIPNINFKL